MDPKVTLGVIVSIYGAIIGLYLWFSRKSEKMVKKDFCNERSGNLEDCIEREAKLSGERFKELKKDMKDGFKEVKELIKNGR